MKENVIIQTEDLTLTWIWVWLYRSAVGRRCVCVCECARIREHFKMEHTKLVYLFTWSNCLSVFIQAVWTELFCNVNILTSQCNQKYKISTRFHVQTLSSNIVFSQRVCVCACVCAVYVVHACKNSYNGNNECTVTSADCVLKYYCETKILTSSKWSKLLPVVIQHLGENSWMTIEEVLVQYWIVIRECFG